MLTLYRRHSASCSKRADRYWKRCMCAMWIEGVTVQGHYIRCSLKTSSWERAQSKASKIDADPDAPAKTARVPVKQGIDEFMEDAKSRGLANSSLRKYNGFYRNNLLKWCDKEGFKFIHELDGPALRRLRGTWRYATQTAHTRQSWLAQLFRFCKKNKWISKNPVKDLSRVRVVQSPTDYFRPDELVILLDAALRYDPLNGHRGGIRLHALIHLMRWSGLRITDSVTLEKVRINPKGELLLYQMKTGNPVFVPLPPHVIDALRYMPPGMVPNLRFFFWSGNGDRSGAADVMHKAFRKAAKDVALGKRCHPHMLRDTFAIEMLLAGVPLDQVSILLGHKNVAMTERHYAPFVKARQEQLAQSVRSAWATASVDAGASGS